jgi:hypothetical protein
VKPKDRVRNATANQCSVSVSRAAPSRAALYKSRTAWYAWRNNVNIEVEDFEAGADELKESIRGPVEVERAAQWDSARSADASTLALCAPCKDGVQNLQRTPLQTRMNM